MAVNTKFAAFDAGYVSEEGFRHLYSEDVSFITLCPTNRSISREMKETELNNLEDPAHLAID